MRRALLLAGLLLAALSGGGLHAAVVCPGVTRSAASRGDACDTPECKLFVCDALQSLSDALRLPSSEGAWLDQRGWWDPWPTFNASCAAAAARAASPPPCAAIDWSMD